MPGTKKLVKGTGGMLVHPNLQPDLVVPKWHRNMPAPQTAVKATADVIEQDISRVTLSANPASRRASEILTDTSLT